MSLKIYWKILACRNWQLVKTKCMKTIKAIWAPVTNGNAKHEYKFLTSGIEVKQERMLQLEIQVFGNWLCQVLHTEPVHDGETMSWRCQSREKGAEHEKKKMCKGWLIQSQSHVLCNMYVWFGHTSKLWNTSSIYLPGVDKKGPLHLSLLLERRNRTRMWYYIKSTEPTSSRLHACMYWVAAVWLADWQRV